MGAHPNRTRILLAALSVGAVLALPGALSTLTGGGEIADLVELQVVNADAGTIVATIASGQVSAPPTAAPSAFSLSNAGSNVDTYVRYDWHGTPYYGANGAQISIPLRSVTHYISDLLWFRQSSADGLGAITSAALYSPLVLKNAASVKTVQWTTQPENACLTWGDIPTGFLPSSEGTLAVDYRLSSALVNDDPETLTLRFCLDDANDQVYVGTTASFTEGTLVRMWSAQGDLDNQPYTFTLAPPAVAGNQYCLVGVTGTGVTATPDFAQCQKLPFDVNGATEARLLALYDPPAYFPATSQGGAVTFAVMGTQWNPYSGDMTATTAAPTVV